MATLKRKIQAQFFKQKVSPGRPVEQFIAELDMILQNLHDIPTRVQNQQHMINNSNKKRNYSRLVKRLKHKLRSANIVLQKTDKSKVFHIGNLQDYQIKSKKYMDKTEAYKCLDTKDPLPDLIDRTNKYLLSLRLAHWINQKQYEQLCVRSEEVELSHLYYLPKAHKLNTPLRPIIAGLKHPTVKISRFLDCLLRPFFDQMAKEDTVTSASELINKLDKWSKIHMKKETLFCTIDVSDLYTMIPQIEGVLSLKKMMDYLELKQIGGLRTEAIIKLSRFVVQNSYFTYDGQYYHQIRGGAMGSPLTLTMANCYMFFFEREIVKQVENSGGLYVRYIDDIFIAINWPDRHLSKQIERWNKIDLNIILNPQIDSNLNFLDLYLENVDGQLFTKVYHKISYELYYLSFNSVHPMHMKKNIPFAMLFRAIKYCSTFETYLNEREELRMALLLNKYPGDFIDKQFSRVLRKCNIYQPLTFNNYNELRDKIMYIPMQVKVPIDYGRTMFIHFTYCLNMKTFPTKFHALWNKYFTESPINEIVPILGTRNVNNLQRRLVSNR